jgi:uncharacterized repeat protein (TIGR01451 family)
VIANVANLTYRMDGSDYGAASNRVAVTVDEIVDFSVTPVSGLKVASGASGQAIAFRLLNRGNASHGFALALDPGQTGDGFDPTACQIYIDPANRELPDRESFQAYRPGAPLSLAAGEAITVWAVCDIPANAGGVGRVVLTARPLSTAGVPLWTPDRATAVNTYRVAEGLSAELIKSQDVIDPLGRPRAIKGATVTYTLTAKLEGEGVARDLEIHDPIPAGSTYIPGSLRLDGQTLTDAADGDVGQAGAQGVEIRLADVPAPALRTVTFQVLITP